LRPCPCRRDNSPATRATTHRTQNETMPLLSDDEFDDDEDWYDDEPDDGDPVPCPECGDSVSDFLDKCPACGYWLSTADRCQLRPHEAHPAWVKFTAVVLLAMMAWGVFTFLF
jgi:hypothetical protein